MTVRLEKQHKFSPKYYGPFKVTAKVGPVALQLALNPQAQIHNVVHVSQLKKHKGELPAGQQVNISHCDQDGLYVLSSTRSSFGHKVGQEEQCSCSVWVDSMN